MRRRKLASSVAIGQRVTLKYSDYNGNFEFILPVKAEVERLIHIGRRDAYILHLDQHINYNSNSYGLIAVLPRYAGEFIGTKTPIEVNVLLPKVTMIDKQRFTKEDFEFVVCCTILPLKNEN